MIVQLPNAMTMKYTAVIALVLFLASCSSDPAGQQAASGHEPAITPTLICKEIRNADENPESPFSEVYVRFGDYQLKVADVSVCLSMDKSEYASQNIPDTALSAVGGWWAGAGDYFYLIADGNNYRILHKAVDEMQESPAEFQTVMVLNKEGEIIAPQ